ncbi:MULTISPECIES: hypothetical protein [unclassified Pseudoalteromonas]|uniref:hypothetical protein n=1 Tax=unclassified Pseudoalteromonas TaxID=194690 RepID=UPI0025B6203F|nr:MULTISPECIES: hypothetical protein [unclassified Pseudoalteromonas]MDN3380266.1 hypothetical protein [Pseudoalteromonas sp. APC 3893]MDN3388656.1 hypothetical protein [Pseudoalteromonas sp. APC 4017]
MTNTFKRLTLLSAILLSTQALAWNNELTLQETKQLTLDGQSLSTLTVEAGSGFLNIVGSNTNSVTVKAEIYQDQPHNNYCLSLKQRAKSAELIANSCNNHDEDPTRIDLTVSIPAKFKLNINDGSGSLSIDNAGATTIHDGSGKIIINNITGSLNIDDGSGSINARDIEGKVVINDGSGSIKLANSLSDVKIHDGSGTINVQNTSGGVTVNDGSGGIYIDTAQSFTLLTDGSGSVKIENVENVKQ